MRDGGGGGGGGAGERERERGREGGRARWRKGLPASNLMFVSLM